MKRRARLLGFLLLIMLASCKEGTFYAALGDQIAATPVAIAPAAATVLLSSSLTFSASGGVPPYSYSVVSGPGTVNATTGVFTAISGGAVIVRVSDKNKKTSDANINVIPTGVDYAVTLVTSAAPQAGNAINGASFTLQNIGNVDGGQIVSWSAYVSTTPTLAGATIIASGTTPKLAVNATRVVPIAPGTWPNTIGGTYFIVVSVTAADDIVSVGNVGASPGYTMGAPTVNYVVTVSYTGALIAVPVLGAVNGASFQFTNLVGPDNGSQLVNWTAYASVSGVVDSSAIAIASGVTQPLAASTSSGVISITGASWPMRYGNYKLVVSVSAPGDLGASNTAASGTPVQVGQLADVEPNNDDTLTTVNQQDLGTTLQPGMSVLVTRSVAGPDTRDVFKLNMGTATSVSLYLSWAPPGQNVTLSFIDGPPVATLATTTIAAGTSLSLSCVTSLQTWIDIANNSGETAYTLIITGN